MPDKELVTGLLRTTISILPMGIKPMSFFMPVRCLQNLMELQKISLTETRRREK